MNIFTTKIHLRWADLDPNFHVRHSVYYDFGAQCRIEILNALGLSPKVMQEQHFGPVLFREECVFRKEIRFSDPIIVHTKIAKMRPDGSRWSIQHDFLAPDGAVHAILTTDGAWLDTKLRKLVTPVPAIILEVLEGFPKTENFMAS